VRRLQLLRMLLLLLLPWLRILVPWLRGLLPLPLLLLLLLHMRLLPCRRLYGRVRIRISRRVERCCKTTAAIRSLLLQLLFLLLQLTSGRVSLGLGARARAARSERTARVRRERVV
jgi:hypothetical protein